MKSPSPSWRGIDLPWLGVFLMNLPVPIYLALELTERAGRIGMSFAILVLLLFGHWLCSRSATSRRPLLAGGILVGLSQAWPALQIMAGLCGFEAAVLLGVMRNSSQKIGSEPAGFVVTLVTGGILMLAAYLLGRLLRAVTPRRWWPDPL